MIYNKVSSFNCDNSENVAYENPSFPAYIRKLYCSSIPNYSFIPHWHEDLEFFVVLSGSVTYHVDGETILLGPSDGIFINSRHMHYGVFDTRGDCEFICILLHPSLLSANADFEKKFVEPFIRNQNYSYLFLDHTVSWQQRILDLLNEMADNQENKMIEAIVQRDFFNIFELLFENITAESADVILNENSEKLNSFKKMILYIQDHYKESVTLNDIAKAVPCCNSKCCALFNEFLKESPVTYLIKYRLNNGCALLRTTDMTITEIALETGFNSSSYFCEAFKKYNGVTPLAYREQK